MSDPNDVEERALRAPSSAGRRPSPAGRRSAAAASGSATGSSPGMAAAASVFLLVIMAGIAVFLFWRAVPGAPGQHRQLLDHQGLVPGLRRRPSSASPPWPAARCSPASSRWSSPSRSPSGIALFIAHYAPRRMASTLGYAGRPAGRGALASSTACGACAFLVPHMVGCQHVAGRPPRLDPALRHARRLVVPPDHVQRRRRARDDDPADHLRGQPRGVPPGAAGPHRGRPGARRHPLGDDAAWRSCRSVAPGSSAPRCSGLGRALGETVAVALVLSTTYDDRRCTSCSRAATPSPRTSRSSTASPASIGVDALIASGLVLFVITLVVNMAARAASSRAAASSPGRTDGAPGRWTPTDRPDDGPCGLAGETLPRWALPVVVGVAAVLVRSPASR